MSTFFGLRRLLRCDSNSPALENRRSEGTDVAVIHKYFLANLPRSGKCLLCSNPLVLSSICRHTCHHSSRLLLIQKAVKHQERSLTTSNHWV